MQSNVQLISASVFATQKVKYLFILNQKLQASCHLLWLCSSVCVQPGWKPEKQGFLAMHLSCSENISFIASVEKSTENVERLTKNASLCLYLTYES